MDQEEKADFRIACDGTWYHDGAPIKRAALAKLFSDRALKIDENGDYWLQTPFEKYSVLVEDVPYIIVDYECVDKAVRLRTNMEETIVLDENRTFELRDGIPYVQVRDGLYARLGRSVFYNMAREFGASFESGDQRHVLGEDSE